MKKGPIILTVSLALVATPLLTPTAASLERVRRGPMGGPIGARPRAPHPIGARPVGPHPFPRGLVSPIVVYAPAPVLYAQPTYADAPALYGPPGPYGLPVASDPPAVYDRPAPAPAPAIVAIAPPPSPTPSVIEYPTGRYELRGDGVTEAYRWVWIPNPPPGPPEPPAGAPVSPGPSAPGGQAPTRHSQLYHWTDPQGVEHWTDRWETIPDPYRDQVKQPRPS